MLAQTHTVRFRLIRLRRISSYPWNAVSGVEAEQERDVTNSEGSNWLRISGICGMLTPLVAFTCTLLAIAVSPHFSWTDNALSDLGVMAGSASIFFNSGLIVSGALALLFASGLLISMKKSLPGRVGALLFLFDSVALVAIGVFPENVRPTHLFASVAFFVLLPLSMMFLAVHFVVTSKVAESFLTLSVAIFASAVWIAEFLWRYVPGFAIPEALSGLSASLWVMTLGFELMSRFAFQ